MHAIHTVSPPTPQHKTHPLTGKRCLHVASTEAAQPRQQEHETDYETCLRKALAAVPGLARVKAMDNEHAAAAAAAAAGGSSSGVEEEAKRLTALVAVRVHPGWEARGCSPAYCGALQRRLVAEVLGGFLGPELLQVALSPPAAGGG
jgi:hypothetical protein